MLVASRRRIFLRCEAGLRRKLLQIKEEALLQLNKVTSKVDSSVLKCLSEFKDRSTNRLDVGQLMRRSSLFLGSVG